MESGFKCKVIGAARIDQNKQSRRSECSQGAWGICFFRLRDSSGDVMTKKEREESLLTHMSTPTSFARLVIIVSI